jgi:hypothetical protein
MDCIRLGVDGVGIEIEISASAGRVHFLIGCGEAVRIPWFVS